VAVEAVDLDPGDVAEGAELAGDVDADAVAGPLELQRPLAGPPPARPLAADHGAVAQARLALAGLVLQRSLPRLLPLARVVKGHPRVVLQLLACVGPGAVAALHDVTRTPLELRDADKRLRVGLARQHRPVEPDPHPQALRQLLAGRRLPRLAAEQFE